VSLVSSVDACTLPLLTSVLLPRHISPSHLILTTESVFSAAGNVVSEKRTRLSCDSIQEDMTLRSWRRAGFIKETIMISLISAFIHLILFDIEQILDIRRLI